jgi:hypothetical protein
MNETKLVFKNRITGEENSPQEWQAALQPGDCYIIECPVGYIDTNPFHQPTIYGEIIGTDDPHDSWVLSQHPGYRLVRGYSVCCEDGESGLMCIVDPTRLLTREEFEEARQQGWPNLNPKYEDKETYPLRAKASVYEE